MIVVRRAAERFETTSGGLVSRHSFSFGAHYDPGNVGFAELVAHNDDLVPVGGGYDTHPHADTEIVTWVLTGSLVHEDSTGRRAVLGPGEVQLLSAGSGVTHSERNDAGQQPTRFVQMWLRPDEPGLEPSVGHAAVDPVGLTPLVSGIRGLDAAVRVHTAGAALHVARLAAGESVELPAAPRLHVFVARGAVTLDGSVLDGGVLGGDVLDGGAALHEGDTARITDEGGATVRALTPAELLVWSFSR